MSGSAPRRLGEDGRDEELGAALRRATAMLAEAGVPSPRADAELLAEHLLGCGLGRLRALAVMGAPVPDGFWDLVAERAKRVPLQHLTGKAPFRHLVLSVGPGVFVPRPETETLVSLALEWIAAQPGLAGTAGSPVVVDLGTGSGAIAASIAAECPTASVHAVELSELAHAWAARNVALPEVGGRVRLVLGDLRTALPELDGAVDVVVSNPPYIPAGMVPREPEAAEHDPELALYGGGEEGLELPFAAISSAARLLRPGGFFAIEHAEVQASVLAARLRADPHWTDVASHRDLNGLPRATTAVRNGVPRVEELGP
ncbi:peptide chain release factor N(5)-glutamine methyltransferase [Sinomonas sp. ASV322]|uniref:peptide chain release factor N(5)-glutamine methyltransferase n=1 Tax=Sinomonas sp. ASV322 TaxID=3041920 RepID=UPI0027DD7503|nr:peptide chain release factor N(5)-glutamine methyltransferase [Sinomonas sp. ASV322]MDQ4502048.1 peptide chain release factor N(5)-glutamine methyltransferase [Sinomonas sp. ASV322]